MSSPLKQNTTTIQELLNTISSLPEVTGGEQATPEISVSSNGLITATAGIKASTHQLAFQPAKTITPSTASQIAVSSGYYTGGNVMVAGDANLVATNIKSGVSIFGVEGTLEGGNGSGEAAEWSENEDAMVTGTLSNYANDRVTLIGSFAFYRCPKLTSVSFPAATIIGTGAFDHCSKLTSVSFPAVTRIMTDAFYYCSNLTSVNFPATTTIENYAFEGCSNLTTVSFPAVTAILSYAFCSCISLTSVSFPMATTTGIYTFRSCSNLTTISFPVATTVGNGAFGYCAKLTSVNFPAVTTIGTGAFVSCSNLTSVSFPVATTIGGDAFEWCSKLTTISFPVVTTIGTGAFGSCSNLTSVNFPAATTIGNYAFEWCSNLTTVSFPAVTNIGNFAFYRCSNLTTVKLLGSSLCALSNSNAFEYTGIKSNAGSIYVPASLLTSYQTATNWAYFSSRFVAYDAGANIITFTISGVEYQAEEGMTWAEWCDSEYNTDEFFIMDAYIIKNVDMIAGVDQSSIIEHNRAYALEYAHMT